MDPKPVCDTPSQYETVVAVSTPAGTRTTRTIAALHAAFLRLLDAQPLDRITVDAIAAEARVHRATFFRHFPTQRALLDDVASAQIEQLSELTLSILRDRDGCAATTALLAYVAEHRNIWSALLSGAEAAMRLRLNAYSMKIADATFPGTTDPLTSFCVRLSTSVVLDSLGWWLSREPGDINQGEFAAIIDGLLGTVQAVQGNRTVMTARAQS